AASASLSCPAQRLHRCRHSSVQVLPLWVNAGTLSRFDSSPVGGEVIPVLQVLEQGRVPGRPPEQLPRAGAGGGAVVAEDPGQERAREVGGGLVRGQRGRRQ